MRKRARFDLGPQQFGLGGGRDPEAAAGLRATDAQRITRALELLDAGHAAPPATG